MLNILIGANDVCGACLDTQTYSADNFESRIDSVLAKARSNFPKTVVNLMMMFNVSGVYEITKNKPQCKIKRIARLSLEWYLVNFYILVVPFFAADNLLLKPMRYGAKQRRRD
jgi:hypothetical protein